MRKNKNTKSNVLKRIFFVTALITLIYCLACMTGCTEEQLKQASDTAKDVNNINSAVQAAVESPAGNMIPTDIKLWLFLGTTIISAAGNVLQKWLGDRLKDTTKSIVKGIENSPPEAQEAVKAEIETVMTSKGNLTVSDTIVNKLKAA